jgi:hypothetical protein
MTIAYFAHELADATVQKRLRMLASAGESVVLLGFERDRGGTQTHSGVVLGATRNGKFAARIVSLGLAIPRGLKHRRQWENARLVIARNLEMLALVIALTRLAGVRPRLVYECLDIHRMVLANGVGGRIVRAVERFCLRRADLVLVSSPAFEWRYFRTIQQFKGRILVAENKVFAAGAAAPAPPPAPPWIIAWCGVLRCKRSLELLTALAQAHAELVRIELWGAPALDQIPDFHERIALCPNVRYHGRYRPEDLPEIYARAHFAWTLDFYEAGGNSDWLLPNRLYESICFGAAPLAAAGAETARWLNAHNVGVVLDAPLERTLPAFFERLDARGFDELQKAAAALPAEATRLSPDACRIFVEELAGAPG